ncbi:CHAD domain-containing protein [Dictyobacter arantiisoli]|uniref:CHAD domain-containing protein n=1 Tax=Dictyobacter arantiisoli TaxID=2014874 RepID=A0A5A5THS8_9CHLR|nr:CHAD domain-containing protein [Dictyobacter arantiisoli]GCF10696.1 hypothetical protein KDI_42600 [Dictyobacter arantiisoli]
MAKAKVVANLDAHALTGQNARAIASVRLEEMYSWAQYVDNSYSVQELHNLRIATKRLRYTLEVFVDTFPDACGAILKELEHIQEELGSLHDKDVMIALLRLCLGGQDSGGEYEQSLAAVAQHAHKGRLMIDPAMMAHLLRSSEGPSPAQREGLEALLRHLQRQRKRQYTVFREHWYKLKGQDFQHQIVTMLDVS